MFGSIVSAIAYYAHNTPDKMCIIDSKRMCSYQEIWEETRNIASYYKVEELSKGDCIAVECTQDARYLICGLACQLAGLIFVPVEFKAVEEKCCEIITDVNAKLLISESNYNISIKRVNMSDMFESTDINTKQLDTQDINSEDVAEILYTTGTTGKPKGIVITNKSNVAVAENIIYGTKMKKDCVELIPLPLSHSHGIRSCYAHFVNGSTIVLTDGVTAVRKIFEYIDRYKITAIDLSPSAARVLLKLSKGNFLKYQEQIDFIQIGTAVLDEELKEELCSIFVKSRLYNFYGSTESGRACILDFNKERGAVGCIGHPTRHAKFIVTDDSRNKIMSSKDNMGLLAISGVMNMKEYWHDYDATGKIMVDGYIYTNDLGYISQAGKVYVVGRSDDVINYKGIKIAPEEIETCAVKYDEIIDCACVSMPDRMCGQAPKLFVVVKNKEQFDKKKYFYFLNDKLSPERVPKYIEIIDEIPRTVNGKIQRKKLMEL